MSNNSDAVIAAARALIAEHLQKQTLQRALQGGTRRGRSPIRDKFIAGPIDVSWVCQASRLGVKALLVGLALWHLKGLRRDNSFLVSNLMLEEWRIQPDAKRGALGALEKAGLIAIERRGKRSPQVTLVVGRSAKGIT
jgi:hypothetical protein